MTPHDTIASARRHRAVGNDGAYARLMSAGIRRAISDKTIRLYHEAIAADGTRALFLNLHTRSPIAA